MPDASATHPAKSGAAAPPAVGWLDLCLRGAAAYADACRAWGDLVAATTTAQADAVARACATDVPRFDALAFWPSEKAFLLVAEGQAERFAEAVRETMHDLGGADARAARLPE